MKEIAVNGKRVWVDDNGKVIADAARRPLNFFFFILSILFVICCRYRCSQSCQLQ